MVGERTWPITVGKMLQLPRQRDHHVAGPLCLAATPSGPREPLARKRESDYFIFVDVSPPVGPLSAAATRDSCAERRDRRLTGMMARCRFLRRSSLTTSQLSRHGRHRPPCVTARHARALMAEQAPADPPQVSAHDDVSPVESGLIVWRWPDRHEPAPPPRTRTSSQRDRLRNPVVGHRPPRGAHHPGGGVCLCNQPGAGQPRWWGHRR